MLLKLKYRRFKKIIIGKKYFIELKLKSISKSKFRYPNNGISNSSLYKKTKTRNLKINEFQIKVFKSINFKINGFKIKQIEWLYKIFIAILALQIEVSGGILVIFIFQGSFGHFLGFSGILIIF